MSAISTKPYLIRAIHEWCTDSGYRPYIAVTVDERTVVPHEFVRGGEIVLNVSSVATNRLSIGNELIEFEARFGGVARMVSIPIENVSAIYAQETGQGMAFEVPRAPVADAESEPVGSEPASAATLVDTATGAAKAAGPAVASGARKPPRLAAVPAVRSESEPGQTGLAAPSDGGAASGGDAGTLPVEGETVSRPARRRRKASGEKSGDPTQAPAATDAASPSSASSESASPIGAGTAPQGPTADIRGPDDDSPKPPPRGRPRLTRVK